MVWLKILPLLVVLVALLPPLRLHVLVAGLLGGAVAAILGGLSVADATDVFFKGLVQIMSITSVMMFAATAMVLARAGSMAGLAELVQKAFRGRLEWVAAGMVLVQALAAYAAGTGAANTLVTAPLTYALVGFVPHLVAGLGIVSGASWATSPASAESAYISGQMGISTGDYAAFMRPYTLALWAFGIALAWYGVRSYSRRGMIQPPTPEELAPEGSRAGPGAAAPTNTADPGAGVGAWRRALPFLALLALIILGPALNRQMGVPLFNNLSIPLVVLAIAAVSVGLSPNRIGEMFIDGGLTILRYLFMVGLFLGFINMMAAIGTFEAIASVIGGLSASIITALALVVAFLIAIPSAAYTVAIDALIIPVLAASGVPVWAFGFVGLAVAQGAMISPVQINVAATAHGFRRDILAIVRNNLPYMPIALAVTLTLAVLVASAAR